MSNGESTGQMFDKTPSGLGAARAKAQAKAIPFHAQLYIENKCNLKCQHCYESEDTHPTDTRLSLAEITRTLEELAGMGCLQLTITGGEIFLRRDIFEILEVAKRLRFQVTLFTSGYHIDRKKAERLRDLKVGQVDISVYSDVAEDHDRFTQIPGSWERSTNALRMLSELGVKASLKCVLTTFNVDHIDGVIQLAKDLGVVFQFDPNVRPRMNNDRSPLQFALSPQDLVNKVYSRRDLYPGFQRLAPEEVCHGSDFQAPNSAMCGAGRSTMAIGASGEVFPCGFFPKAAGSLRDSSLADIWNGSSLMNEVRSTTYGTMKACSSCDVKSACHPCMAYAQVEHGDFRECNTASRDSAEALMDLSGRAARANRKLSRAKRSLPIVGDTRLPAVDGTAAAALGMFD